MARAKHPSIPVLLALLSIVFTGTFSWPQDQGQDLSSMGDSYRTYQEMVKRAQEANAKRQQEALAEAVVDSQRQKAVKQQIDPIIRYMDSPNGSGANIPPIYKAPNLDTPGKYNKISDAIYINPDKFNDPKFSRDFVKSTGAVTNADMVVMHEVSHKKLSDAVNAGVVHPPPAALASREAYTQWEESYADKGAEAYYNIDKARFETANDIARKMRSEALKKGQSSSVKVYDSFDQYMADSNQRSQKLLETMSVRSAPPGMLPAQNYMSAEDRRDAGQMLQNIAKIQDITRTVTTRGRAMSRGEINMYCSQVRSLNAQTQNLALGIGQRNQMSIPPMPGFGVDASQISASQLERHAAAEMGWAAAGIAADSVLPAGIGTLITAGQGVAALNNARRVGLGITGPDALRGTIPHVVQAWDAIKGPQNMPTQNMFTATNSIYNDGFLRSQTQGIKMIQKNFRTSAPGVIGNYGYDPITDRIKTTTSSQSITRTTSGWGTSNFKSSNVMPVPALPKIRIK